MASRPVPPEPNLKTNTAKPMNFWNDLLDLFRRANGSDILPGNGIGDGPTMRRVLAPREMVLHEVDVEPSLDRPRRPRAVVTVDTPESFIRYVREHIQPGTHIFASVDPKTGRGSIVAVLDYNERSPDGGEADWGEHIVRTDLPRTPEWDDWCRMAARGMVGQQEFAEFLEEMLPDVANPATIEPRSGEPAYATAEDLFRVAQSLSLRTEVQFAGALNLQNGNVRLNYTEQTDQGGEQNGNLEVPRMFALKLPIYRGSSPFIVRCRLKYRCERGAVSFAIQMTRVHRVLEAALADVLNLVYDGRPGADGVEELVGTGIRPLVGHIDRMGPDRPGGGHAFIRDLFNGLFNGPDEDGH